MWQEDKVLANEASDPYLMTGFDKKVLHVSMDDLSAPLPTENVTVQIELDTLGNAMHTGRWRRLATVTLSAENSWFVPYVFAEGMSAQWASVSKIRTNPSSLPRICSRTLIGCSESGEAIHQCSLDAGPLLLSLSADVRTSDVAIPFEGPGCQPFRVPQLHCNIHLHVSGVAKQRCIFEGRYFISFQLISIVSYGLQPTKKG